jgi:superfamily II DNA or RNA helicase
MDHRGYIYMLYNESFNIFSTCNDDVRKIGSTKNPTNRFFDYLTYYPTRSKFLKVIEITAGDNNCYQIDNLLWQHCTELSYPYSKVQWSGGFEFYKITDSNLLMEWLHLIGANPIDKTEYYTDISKRITKKLNNYTNDKKLLFRLSKFDDNKIRLKEPFQMEQLDKIMNNTINSYEPNSREILYKKIKSIQFNNVKNVTTFANNAYNELRDYQKNAVDVFSQKLSDKYFQGLYLMATGLGKSHIAITCALLHLKKYPNDNILWISYRNDIIDSQKKLFNKFPNIFILCLHGKNKINCIDSARGKIFVVLRQSLVSNRFKKGILNGVIYDECHDASKVSEIDDDDNVISGSTYKILKDLEKHHKLKYRIGFSATPLTTNKKQNYGVVDLYGENNQINYLYKMSLLDGVKQNWLSKPCLKYLIFDTNSAQIKQMYNMCDKDKEDIFKLCSTTIDKIMKWIDDIIEFMIYKKGILWFPDTKVQMFFYDIISKKFDKLNVYYSSAHYSIDDNVFAECEKNALMIACRKFTTGFDGRNMEFGINFVLDDTDYRVIQKIGRFLRHKELQKNGYFYQLCQSADVELNKIVSNIVENLKTIEFDSDQLTNITKKSTNNLPNSIVMNKSMNLYDFINITFSNAEIDYNKLCYAVNNKINVKNTIYKIENVPSDNSKMFNDIKLLNDDEFTIIKTRIENNTATQEDYIMCNKKCFMTKFKENISTNILSKIYYEIYCDLDKCQYIRNIYYAKNKTICNLFLYDRVNKNDVNKLELYESKLIHIEVLNKMMGLKHCQDIDKIVDRKIVHDKVNSYLIDNYAKLINIFACKKKELPNDVGKKNLLLFCLLNMIYKSYGGSKFVMKNMNKCTKNAESYILSGHNFYDQILIVPKIE